MQKVIRNCSMKGCHNQTVHASQLCEQCRVHVFEGISGTKMLHQKKPSAISVMWDLLPSGADINTRMTSLGELSFKKLHNIASVLGVK